MTAGTILTPEFYHKKTETVAKALLGKILVRKFQGQKISGRITEVEAYLGLIDKAAHSYGKVTPRNKGMYVDGGHAYVYLIYGLYHCLNAVTRAATVPEAVLIRSLEPLEGIDWMMKFRQTDKLKNLTTGPGKLGEALHVDKSLNGVALQGPQLWIEDAAVIPKSKIVARPRVGVDYAEEAADWPLRFYIKDCEFISRK